MGIQKVGQYICIQFKTCQVFSFIFPIKWPKFKMEKQFKQMAYHNWWNIKWKTKNIIDDLYSILFYLFIIIFFRVKEEYHSNETII